MRMAAKWTFLATAGFGFGALMAPTAGAVDAPVCDAPVASYWQTNDGEPFTTEVRLPEGCEGTLDVLFFAFAAPAGLDVTDGPAVWASTETPLAVERVTVSAVPTVVELDVELRCGTTTVIQSDLTDVSPGFLAVEVGVPVSAPVDGRVFAGKFNTVTTEACASGDDVPTPTTQPESLAPAGDVVVAPVEAASSVAVEAAESVPVFAARRTDLPSTGGHVAQLFVAALVSIVVGVGGLLASRRSRLA